MSLLEAIVLGIAQGLTEFLPISSTGHLRIVPAFLGWEDPGAAFTAVTQLGTMAAVLLYFRDDLLRIARAWLRSLTDRPLRRELDARLGWYIVLGTMAAVLLYFRADLARIARAWVHSVREPAARCELDARLGWYILLGTIPIGIFGVLFKDQIETGARDLYLIGIALIVLGLVLLAAERVGTRERSIEQIRTKDGFAIGLAQALALIPGVSRSGATITAGLFMGLDRPAAARFSFLLSVPAVVLSGLLELGTILSDEEGDGTGLVALVVATVMAFVSGYLAIAWLLRFLSTHSTVIFVVYRVALGALVLALVGAGAIE